MHAGSVDVLAHGLTAVEAAARLRHDGRNVLPSGHGPSALRPLLAQLTHFFAVMLWIAAGLAWLAGLRLAVAIVVVLLNGIFSFAQEYRADQATARLGELLPARVQVLRDGRRTWIGADELVIGDLVLLTSGDRISADLSVMHCDQLAVDESMLTGESVPVHPEAGTTLHAGTFVVEGSAYAVVDAARRARLAGIADLTRQARRRPSPLAVQLHRWSGPSRWWPSGSASASSRWHCCSGQRPRTGSCSPSASPWRWCRRGCCRPSRCPWPGRPSGWPGSTRWCAGWRRSRPSAPPPSSAPTRPAP